MVGSPLGEPPDLLRENTTFQYVRQVRFELKKRLRTSAWDTTQAWIQGLSDRGTTRLRLGAREWGNPDLASIGSAGPARGAIFTQGSTGTEVWASHSQTNWDPNTDYPADRRIWLVTYRGQLRRTSSLPATSTLDQALTELLTALEDIRLFAVEQEVEGWPQWFQEAIELAGSDDPEIPYHPDAIPSDAPLDQRRVAAVAFKTWVFGGMGSWNDKFLEDPAAAERDRVVSDRLYGAILGGLDAVANA